MGRSRHRSRRSKKQRGPARPIVIVPIAFVSEHSETLVELDIEYRRLAEKHGAAAYERAPTVSEDPDFIAGLAAAGAHGPERRAQRVQPGAGAQFCAAWPRCALPTQEGL